MNIPSLLRNIYDIAKMNGHSEPFIVGGLARDRLLNFKVPFEDIDITTGDASGQALANSVAASYKDEVKKINIFKDRHVSLIFNNNIKVDFSSNFLVPGINHYLQTLGVNAPTRMQKELFSRDFTCNTALMTLDLKKIYDPTGKALKDISNKILNVCLTPELTLGYYHKRIARIVYLAAKLDFDVAPEIITWVRENIHAFNSVDVEYNIRKIKKAAEFNKEKTTELLRSMDLIEYASLIGG